MKLEITKERILEAASKCSTAKETLKTLFPEVFEEEKYFDFSGVKIKFENLPRGFDSNYFDIRRAGDFVGKGFYLTDNLYWKIIKEDKCQVLIPTKK